MENFNNVDDTKFFNQQQNSSDCYFSTFKFTPILFINNSFRSLLLFALLFILLLTPLNTRAEVFFKKNHFIQVVHESENHSVKGFFRKVDSANYYLSPNYKILKNASGKWELLTLDDVLIDSSLSNNKDDPWSDSFENGTIVYDVALLKQYVQVAAGNVSSDVNGFYQKTKSNNKTYYLSETHAIMRADTGGWATTRQWGITDHAINIVDESDTQSGPCWNANFLSGSNAHFVNLSDDFVELRTTTMIASDINGTYQKIQHNGLTYYRSLTHRIYRESQGEDIGRWKIIRLDTGQLIEISENSDSDHPWQAKFSSNINIDKMVSAFYLNEKNDLSSYRGMYRLTDIHNGSPAYAKFLSSNFPDSYVYRHSDGDWVVEPLEITEDRNKIVDETLATDAPRPWLATFNNAGWISLAQMYDWNDSFTISYAYHSDPQSGSNKNIINMVSLANTVSFISDKLLTTDDQQPSFAGWVFEPYTETGPQGEPIRTRYFYIKNLGSGDYLAVDNLQEGSVKILTKTETNANNSKLLWRVEALSARNDFIVLNKSPGPYALSINLAQVNQSGSVKVVQVNNFNTNANTFLKIDPRYLELDLHPEDIEVQNSLMNLSNGVPIDNLFTPSPLRSGGRWATRRFEFSIQNDKKETHYSFVPHLGFNPFGYGKGAQFSPDQTEILDTLVNNVRELPNLAHKTEWEMYLIIDSVLKQLGEAYDDSVGLLSRKRFTRGVIWLDPLEYVKVDNTVSRWDPSVFREMREFFEFETYINATGSSMRIITALHEESPHEHYFGFLVKVETPEGTYYDVYDPTSGQGYDPL